MVQPNELARETPYLKNNIEFTRKPTASTRSRKHLTSAGRSDFRGDCEKSRHDPERPSLGLAALLQMYQQAQEIRLYYHFYQADVDRYHLPDGYHR